MRGAEALVAQTVALYALIRAKSFTMPQVVLAGTQTLVASKLNPIVHNAGKTMLSRLLAGSAKLVARLAPFTCSVSFIEEKTLSAVASSVDNSTAVYDRVFAGRAGGVAGAKAGSAERVTGKAGGLACVCWEIGSFRAARAFLGSACGSIGVFRARKTLCHISSIGKSSYRAKHAACSSCARVSSLKARIAKIQSSRIAVTPCRARYTSTCISCPDVGIVFS